MRKQPQQGRGNLDLPVKLKARSGAVGQSRETGNQGEMRLKEQEKIRLDWRWTGDWEGDSPKDQGKMQRWRQSPSAIVVMAAVCAGVRSLPRGKCTAWHCLMSGLDCAQHYLCPHAQATYIPSTVFSFVKWRNGNNCFPCKNMGIHMGLSGVWGTVTLKVTSCCYLSQSSKYEPQVHKLRITTPSIH